MMQYDFDFFSIELLLLPKISDAACMTMDMLISSPNAVEETNNAEMKKRNNLMFNNNYFMVYCKRH